MDALLDKLGYRFEKPELLERALTHVSAPGAGGQSYQRLEFLGDRVLGLSIAEMLYAAFSDAPEGELSRRLAELVRRETCAEVAIAWDVGPYVKLGAGEAHSGERRNLTILADVCEAIIGAVFIDGGYAAAKELVERSFGGLLNAPRRALRDPKSALQEWAQGKGLPTPIYAVVEQTGPDHAPRFRIVVKVKGVENEFGTGTSKRIAEQAAARGLLLREGVWTEEEHGVA
nr:ribonuclease III [Microvirga terricola]